MIQFPAINPKFGDRAMLISIVTPCLDRAAFIAEAVESVQHQDHEAVQHLVVDGGSTDGTLDILRRYGHLRVHSEPDDGIYDALNKGIAMSDGEVIGFLNTDDLYEPDILGAVGRAFADPRIDAAVGRACIFTDEGPSMSFPPVAPGDLLARATVGAPIFNAWFFRRSLLDHLSGFDITYRYVADRDLLIRMALSGGSYTSIELPVYRYRMHPGSVTLSGRESGEDEYMFESRRLAQHHLRSSASSRAERDMFRAWHGQIVMEQILTAFHAGGYGRAMRHALVGVRHDPGFVIALISELLRRLPGSLTRMRQQDDGKRLGSAWERE